MSLFDDEQKKIAIGKILSDHQLKSTEKFSRLIIVLQGNESNSDFADKLEVTHSTIGRWRKGDIGELTEGLYYKISFLTEYSPGELLELMNGEEPKIRKIKTSDEAFRLLKELSEAQCVDLCLQLTTNMSRRYKATFVASIAQEIIEK